MWLKWLKKYGLSMAGVMVGALGGYLYYRTIGCASGHCAITSSPINSTLYGALMGYLFFNLFQKNKTENA